MSIITILMVIWFFNRSYKLKETKDIEKYVLTCPRRIKDRDGYIKFYSKIYYRSGISLIIFEIFCTIFIAAFIEAIIIDKKSHQFV